MKFNTKALALASAVVWGFVMLAVGVTNSIEDTTVNSFSKQCHRSTPAIMARAALLKSSLEHFMDFATVSLPAQLSLGCITISPSLLSTGRHPLRLKEERRASKC